LGHVFDVGLAGRLFLGACVFLTVAGVVTLHRVIFQRWSYWPLIAALPAYHGALMAGFINFSMGVALLPFGIAAWIALESNSTTLRLCAHSIVVLVLYFCHVLTVGFLGIFLGCYTVWQIAGSQRGPIFSRRSVIELLILIVPFLISAWLYIQHSLLKVTEREAPVLLGHWELGPKLRGIMMPVLTYDLLLDSLALIVLLGTPIILLAYRQLDIKAALVPGIGFMLFLFIVLPGALLDAAFIMERFVIAAILIAIAATQPRTLPLPIGRGIALAVFALVLARTGVLTANWIESDAYYQRMRVMSESIERGSSVLIVSPFSLPDLRTTKLWRHRLLDYPDWHYALINIPNLHAMPILPLTERGTFSQLHFVWPDKQILSLQDQYQAYDQGDGGTSTKSPSEIFHVDENGGISLKVRDTFFDYILILYANHLSPTLRQSIPEQDPLYADGDIILMGLR
ncbi:MAG: hypothetical protein ACRBM6_35635, partial [Geminicoccales bacterium]